MAAPQAPKVGSLGFAQTALWRGYQDFLMPSRLHEYRKVLETARDHGYQMISVAQWAQRVEAGHTAGKIVVLRHDVDTDPRQTLISSQIEQSVGASASYFFRLPTMNAQVVRTVADRGFHVSYHFEELASYAKQYRLRNADEVQTHMPRIQQQFGANLTKLRNKFGLDMRIVCSHGDWMNRKLGVMNHALVADEGLRRELGIDYETYDAALVKPMAAYVSDYPGPWWWRPEMPATHLEKGIGPIGILTHPRQWRRRLYNAVDIAQRMYEGAAYKLRT